MSHLIILQLWGKLCIRDFRHPIFPVTEASIMHSAAFPTGFSSTFPPSEELPPCQTCSIPEQQDSVTPSCCQGMPSGPPPDAERPGLGGRQWAGPIPLNSCTSGSCWQISNQDWQERVGSYVSDSGTQGNYSLRDASRRPTSPGVPSP